jgi:IclR family pca regulon transcriptional regulator
MATLLVPSERAPGLETLSRWEGDPDFMLSLAKGLLVLHAVTAKGRGVSIAELAAHTGLTRPTVRRCIHTLSTLGYLQSDETGAAPGPNVASLISAYISASPLISRCAPALNRLRDQIQETVTLWVYDGGEAIHVARAEGGVHFRNYLPVGARRNPLYATSIGRLLLAFRPQVEIDDYLANTVLSPQTPKTVTSVEKFREILGEIRRVGYAIGDQEASIGLRSVTVAVRDERGNVVAGLNLGTEPGTVSMRELRARYLPRLQDTAVELTALLAQERVRQGAISLRAAPSGRSAADKLDDWVENPSFMLSLARGLLALRTIVEAGRPISISELSVATGLSRATARRCVYTLIALGHVLPDALGGVAGPRLASLTSAYIQTSPLLTAYNPILDRLYAQVGYPTSLWIRHGISAVYTAHRQERRLFRTNYPLGARAPLHCTSIGRVLLAFQPQAEVDDYLAQIEFTRVTPRTVDSRERFLERLAEVRAQGYAIADQELETGLRAVSVPVRSGQGDVVAVINVGTPAGVVGLRELRARILPPLLRAAAEFSALLP